MDVGKSFNTGAFAIAQTNATGNAATAAPNLPAMLGNHPVAAAVPTPAPGTANSAPPAMLGNYTVGHASVTATTTLTTPVSTAPAMLGNYTVSPETTTPTIPVSAAPAMLGNYTVGPATTTPTVPVSAAPAMLGKYTVSPAPNTATTTPTVPVSAAPAMLGKYTVSPAPNTATTTLTIPVSAAPAMLGSYAVTAAPVPPQAPPAQPAPTVPASSSQGPAAQFNLFLSASAPQNMPTTPVHQRKSVFGRYQPALTRAPVPNGYMPLDWATSYRLGDLSTIHRHPISPTVVRDHERIAQEQKQARGYTTCFLDHDFVAALPVAETDPFQTNCEAPEPINVRDLLLTLLQWIVIVYFLVCGLGCAIGGVWGCLVVVPCRL